MSKLTEHNFDKDDLAVNDGDVWVNGNLDLRNSGSISTTGAGATNVEGTVDRPAQVSGVLNQGAGVGVTAAGRPQRSLPVEQSRATMRC